MKVEGIQAIVDEIGHDSFILGCNAPFWPLLGLVHGNRVTNDIARDWKHVKGNAEQLFPRNWHGEIVEKKSTITDKEFEFHKAVILASDGMILSGDLIT